MATAFLRAESARANPLDIFTTFDRSTLASAVEVLVAVLDTMDGDPDIEPNGDELDGTAAEDDFCLHSNWKGEPGCPIGDPDLAVDDGACDDINMDLEPEEALTPDYGIDQTKPIPDALVIASDRSNTREHRDRIRRESCDKVTRWGVTEYRLR